MVRLELEDLIPLEFIFYFLFSGARGCGSYYFSINRYKKAPKWGILKSISSSISRHTYKFCTPNGKHFHLDWFWDWSTSAKSFLLSVLAILNVLFKVVLLQTTLYSPFYFLPAESSGFSKCHLISGMGIIWVPCLSRWASSRH